MFDKDPDRCRGAKVRGAARCKRFGTPVGGEYWCHNHAWQRDATYGKLMRQLDKDEARDWFGVYE